MCTTSSCKIRPGMLVKVISLDFDLMLTLTCSLYVCDCAQLDCMTGVWLCLFLSANKSLQCLSLLFLSLPLPLSLYCLKHEQKIGRNKGELWKLSKHVAVHPDTFSKSTYTDDKHLSFTQKGLHFSELKPRTV